MAVSLRARAWVRSCPRWRQAARQETACVLRRAPRRNFLGRSATRSISGEDKMKRYIRSFALLVVGLLLGSLWQGGKDADPKGWFNQLKKANTAVTNAV